ncbi:YqaA family protein [Novosphingobium sp.]|uniref:YqaA family protein n=1 Tax=Novosphingobium sp. TaxID=1874826 RepID=UPI0027372D02|nr:VTT domain-containing protein [Novosphingobium sp.]MDP3906332.1 VTT domain-containing protein [Novosphingobium sp.]
MLRSLYDWTMAKAAHRHAERWLAFFCFIEAFFFPIPPHPLLGLMCLAEPKKAVRFGLIATAASVIGGLFGYALGYFLYEAVGAVILSGLGLAEAFPKAACYLREYDVEVIIIAGTTPIPFKLLTITAGFIEMALVPFILASIAGRATIFLGVGILFRLFGTPIKAFIDKYLGLLTALFGVLIVAGFIALALVGGDAKQSNEKCELATMADIGK